MYSSSKSHLIFQKFSEQGQKGERRGTKTDISIWNGTVVQLFLNDRNVHHFNSFPAHKTHIMLMQLSKYQWHACAKMGGAYSHLCHWLDLLCMRRSTMLIAYAPSQTYQLTFSNNKSSQWSHTTINHKFNRYLIDGEKLSAIVVALQVPTTR